MPAAPGVVGEFTSMDRQPSSLTPWRASLFGPISARRHPDLPHLVCDRRADADIGASLERPRR